MVFLSEASIREMVQEALGGGGYPTLDGDGNFPIIPSPLAEPIVTKMGLQPVRVMRVPTDKHEFELAVKELVDGVENDHLPTLFLKLRELVSDFVPAELESSPCPHDDANSQDVNTMSNHNPPADQMSKIRAEVRKLIKSIVSESDEDSSDGDKVLAMFRPGGSRYRPPYRQGIANLPGEVEKDVEDPTVGDDWDSDDVSLDDPGSAETDPADDPYPEEYLKNQGYPDIGEDPEYQTWEDLEKEIAGSAWEPDARGSEMDKFRGRDDIVDQVDKAAAAIDDAPKRPTDAVGGEMKWEDIGTTLGISKGAAHGAAAIGARKLQYIGEYLGPNGFQEFYDDATDKYINFLITQGAEKDEQGKPLLSMGEVMDLRSASMFEKDDDGEQTSREMDDESGAIRKAIQGLDGFRDFLNQRLEYEMEVDGYAVSHADAAKDKDKSSIFHRMKRTTR